MIGLLEIRERIKLIYSKHEVFILPAVKFLFAFIVLNVLNGKIGYMTRLDNIAIVLIVALMCSFLPTGCMVMFAALFSILHLYALSMEVALVALCMFLVMFLLFFRFSPKDSVLVLLTPLLCVMKIPYVVPIAAGLICSPASAVSVGCGVAVYYLFHTVITIAPTLSTMGDSEITAKLRLIIDGIVKNQEMLVVIAAFAITIIVVYLIRRMSMDHVWTIAMVAGAMTDIVILLIGDLVYDINISVLGTLLGSVLALAVAKVIEFFRFCVDYSRTEKVQFEDDEYYYYVKAVPKMTVSAPSKTVKRINAQRHRSGEYGAAAERPRNAAARAGRTRGDYRGGKRAAMEDIMEPEEEIQDTDDYEELF